MPHPYLNHDRAFPSSSLTATSRDLRLIDSEHQYHEQQVVDASIHIKQDITIKQPALPSTAPSFETSWEKIGAKRQSKPRLRCPIAGCRLTFPRNYELKRHLKHFHTRNNIYCPVYGCNRTTKLFARMNKFRENFRKQNNPDQFLCVLDGCEFGHGTRVQLKEHLASQLHHYHLKLSDVVHVMNLVECAGGLPLLELSKKRVEGTDACPLRSIGCSFHLSSNEPSLVQHVSTHELIDRSVCHDDIRKEVKQDWQLKHGLVSCPICKEVLFPSDRNDGLWEFLVDHVPKQHTRRERMKHAPEIEKLLAPYVTGKELVTDHLSVCLKKLAAELGWMLE